MPRTEAAAMRTSSEMADGYEIIIDFAKRMLNWSIVEGRAARMNLSTLHRFIRWESIALAL